MSHSHDQMSGLMDARAVEARAANWLQRRQFWDWSDSDQAALDQWLAESEVHLVTYLRLEAAWSRTERLVALGLAKMERSNRMRAGPFGQF